MGYRESCVKCFSQGADTEDWHRRFNSIATNRGAPDLYSLINLLGREASFFSAQIKLISIEKMRKRQKMNDNGLWKFWDCYDLKNITSELLRKARKFSSILQTFLYYSLVFIIYIINSYLVELEVTSSSFPEARDSQRALVHLHCNIHVQKVHTNYKQLLTDKLTKQGLVRVGGVTVGVTSQFLAYEL